MSTSRVTGPYVNVAAPNQTPEQLQQMKLELWASGMIKRLSLRTATRYDIELALKKMPTGEQEEAKRLLNYYRAAK